MKEKLEDLSWGNWLTDTATITLPPDWTVITASAYLVSRFPYLPVAIATGIAANIVGKYDTVSLTQRIRFATDDTYQYYEAYYTVRADEDIVYESERIYRKKALNGA